MSSFAPRSLASLRGRRGKKRKRLESVKCPRTGELSTALLAWFGIDSGQENTSEVLNEGA